MEKFNKLMKYMENISDRNLNDSEKEEIVKYTSELLTGKRITKYNDGLKTKMFKKGYNYRKEFQWVVDDTQKEKEMNDKITKVHYLYLTNLGRYADLQLINNIESVDIISMTVDLKRSIEKKCVDWYNEGKDPYLEETLNSYVTKLGYLPSIKDLINLWLNKGTDIISKKNDYIYLQECLENFENLSKTKETEETKETTEEQSDRKKVKYYGPVGTSGYAKICRDIIESIYVDLDIYFEVIQFHNYHPNLKENELLSQLYNKSKNTDYDYIIFHSTPELWPVLAKIERQKNKEIIIYGITVWETEVLPKKWEEYIQCVDKVSVPSEFSGIAFRKSDIPVDIVQHPIIVTHKFEKCYLYGIKEKYKYIFYNISEWSNRKGITELIEIFHETFKDSKDTMLYIKCFGDISESEGTQFLKRIGTKNVVLDYTRVSDEYINCIHRCGDCYVSLTKAEGHGIGVCHAAMFEKNIIITGYSGYLDYLTDINYIKYTLEPATICTFWSKKHSECLKYPSCKNFDKFIPAQGHQFARADPEDTKEKMVFAYTTNQKGTKNCKEKISQFNKENFVKKLKESLYGTKKRIIKEIKKSVITEMDCRPQIEFFEERYHKKEMKKVVVVNAGGYGNVGDSSYNYIISKYFEGKVELIFISDKRQDKDTTEFDYLIIGGGGLFNKERIINKRFNAIHMYTKEAIAKKKPYYIVSTGFQDCDNLSNLKETFGSYTEIFKEAQLVYTRSVTDFHIITTLTGSNENVYVERDLVYFIDHFYKPVEMPRNKLVVVMDSWINLSRECVVTDIKKWIIEYELELVFTEFTGIDPNKKSELNRTEIEKHFTDYTIISGIETDLDPSRTTSIEDMIDLIVSAKVVICGRYHSMIYSKVYHVPVIETYNYCNYKFIQEEKIILDTTLRSLPTIENLIENEIYYNNNLSEDQRNTLISKVWNISGIDIQMIQNWTNRKLQEYLQLKP